jgi:hypothetical protein
MFEVEKGIPLHRKQREKNGGIPFENLAEKGDSFFVPETKARKQVVKVSAHRFAKENGLSLAVQSETGGCRVYRL